MQMQGKKLGGRYEIIGRIGGGGMAVVYKAVDSLLHRQVAIKVLNESLSNNSEFIRRFDREAQAAASLSHPNVVNVYDVGRDGYTHYIVMELVEKGDLYSLAQEANGLCKCLIFLVDQTYYLQPLSVYVRTRDAMYQIARAMKASSYVLLLKIIS